MPTDVVYLENQDWTHVNVDVRKGNDPNPENNAPLGSQRTRR